MGTFVASSSFLNANKNVERFCVKDAVSLRMNLRGRVIATEMYNPNK
jgi:hypothetical protein